MTELRRMIDSDKPTLIEFFATWSADCSATMPVVAQLQAEMRDAVNIVQIDGPQNRAYVDAFGVAVYPTWLLFKSGELVWRETGLKELADLKYVVGRTL